MTGAYQRSRDSLNLDSVGLRSPLIKHFSLGHFKTFRTLADVPLAPITLIYGANSSGKSTLIQALMLMKQTLESSAAPTSALIFDSSTYLNLGNFQNIVSDHERGQDITLGIGLDPKVFLPRSTTRKLTKSLANAQLLFTIGADGTGNSTLRSCQLRLSDDAPPVATYTRSSLKVRQEDMLRILGPRSRRRRSGVRPSDLPVLTLSDLDVGSDLIADAFEDFEIRRHNVLQSLTSQSKALEDEPPEDLDPETPSETLLKQYQANRVLCEYWIKRLSSYDARAFEDDVREYNKSRQLIADRFLPFATSWSNEKGASGFSHYRPLFTAREERYASASPFPDFALVISTLAQNIEEALVNASYIGPLREFPSRNYIFSAGGESNVGTRGENLPSLMFSSQKRIEELNRLADMMELNYEVSARRSQDPELDNVFAVRLLDRITKASVGLSDVGFGISQVLPILMQCALSSTETVLIEQPEIHLNPKLQSTLAQVFAESLRHSSRQFIIETHSEHLLLRFQRLIRDRVVKHQDVIVLYVSKDSSGSAIMPIPLGEDGERLIPWPDDFFDDTYRELFT